MLKLHQSVIALIVAAAWCGIVVSMAGPSPVAAAKSSPAAAAAPTYLTNVYPLATGPVTMSDDLVAFIAPAAVPADQTMAVLAHPVASPAIVAVQPPPPAVIVVATSERWVPVETFAAAAASVGWQVTDALLTIARCESGADLDHDGVKESLDAKAQSPTGDRGPLQINIVHARPGGIIERMGYNWDDMLEVVPNAVVGLALYHSAEAIGRDGFSPWMCRPN